MTKFMFTAHQSTVAPTYPKAEALSLTVMFTPPIGQAIMAGRIVYLREQAWVRRIDVVRALADHPEMLRYYIEIDITSWMECKTTEEDPVAWTFKHCAGNLMPQ